MMMCTLPSFFAPWPWPHIIMNPLMLKGLPMTRYPPDDQEEEEEIDTDDVDGLQEA